MSLSARELSAISITERVCSAVSLLGACTIVVTFLASRSFRKPINRLVFYASWGNLMANAATLIAQSGIQAGTSSCLCRFQAFFIQWFLPADALWAFCMACNVYLTFFHKYDADRLRRLEWKYLLCCYGLPLIPALSYFFIETKERGRIYGPATLWCWVAPSWDFLRIAVFYGPVWFIIILTLAIYASAGICIYRKKRELCDTNGSAESDSSIEFGNPFDPSSFSRVTEVQVTRQGRHAHDSVYNLAHNSLSMLFQRPTKPPYSPYLVTIEAGGEFGKLSGKSPKPTKVDQLELSPRRHAMFTEANSAAWTYTKYASLFFVTLLVTWIPSTANRLYIMAHPEGVNFGLHYASSFVLPLQGFWNCVIYLSISWSAVKKALSQPKERRPTLTGDNIRRKLSISPPIALGRSHTTSRLHNLAVESESVEELTGA